MTSEKVAADFRRLIDVAAAELRSANACLNRYSRMLADPRVLSDEHVLALVTEGNPPTPAALITDLKDLGIVATELAEALAVLMITLEKRWQSLA